LDVTSYNKSSMASSMFASKGGTWKGLVYFDPAADKPGDPEKFTNDELREKLGSMIDPSEKILQVRLLKTPLFAIQWSNFLLYHVFVHFATAKYEWSIEKNSQGITIQRSELKVHSSVIQDRYKTDWTGLIEHYDESAGAVINRYRQQPRCGMLMMTGFGPLEHTSGYWKPKLIIADGSNKYMKDVVDFLYDSGALNKKYNLANASCKHFAQGFFNEFARKKTWSFVGQ